MDRGNCIHLSGGPATQFFLGSQPCVPAAWLAERLLLAGDIESNPGTKTNTKDPFTHTHSTPPLTKYTSSSVQPTQTSPPPLYLAHSPPKTPTSVQDPLTLSAGPHTLDLIQPTRPDSPPHISHHTNFHTTPPPPQQHPSQLFTSTPPPPLTLSHTKTNKRPPKQKTKRYKFLNSTQTAYGLPWRNSSISCAQHSLMSSQYKNQAHLRIQDKTFTNILYQAGKKHIPVGRIRNTDKLLTQPIHNKIAHRNLTSKKQATRSQYTGVKQRDIHSHKHKQDRYLEGIHRKTMRSQTKHKHLLEHNTRSSTQTTTTTGQQLYNIQK